MIVKNVEKKEKSTVSFDVLCDAAEFEKAVNGAYLKNKSKIFVQGFRKGKAPRMIIEGLYGKDVFYDDAADALAPEAFRFAVEQEKLRTVGNPAVKAVDVSDDKELTLSFVTAVWPEVTLGQYKGLEAPKAKVSISDEQVAEELEKVASSPWSVRPSWRTPRSSTTRAPWTAWPSTAARRRATTWSWAPAPSSPASRIRWSA